MNFPRDDTQSLSDIPTFRNQKRLLVETAREKCWNFSKKEKFKEVTGPNNSGRRITHFWLKYLGNKIRPRF